MGSTKNLREAAGAALLMLLALAACRTGPRPQRPSSPAVVIRQVVEQDIPGYEAVIRVPTSPGIVEAWLVGFDTIAPDRPNVLESKLVRSEPGAWVSRFRFRGYLGIHPTAVVRTTRRTEGTSVVLDFEAVESSLGLTAMFGSYRISLGEGGGSVVTHRLFVASPFATQVGLEADMLEDANAMVEALGRLAQAE